MNPHDHLPQVIQKLYKAYTQRRYIHRITSAVVLAFLAVAFTITVAQANQGVLSSWVTTYPDSASDDNAGCQLCHVNAGGGSPWNGYGWQLRQQIVDNGLSVTDALAALEAMDSDGNGSSNLDEINADTQPGWTEGNVHTSYLKDGTTETNQPPPSGLPLDPAGSETPTETPSSTPTPSPSATPVPLENPIEDPIGRGAYVLSLTTVATDFVAPLWGTTAPSLTNNLFVIDQPGEIWNVNLTTGSKALFADLSGDLVELGTIIPNFPYDERGLLGMAFSPDYATSGHLYTYASEPISGTADFSTIPDGEMADHQSVLAEWTVDNPTDASSVVNASTKRVLLRIDQPQFNHNGGHIAFGPDGMLYIGLGDGGNADDEGMGHSAQGNSQDATNPLGSILRIDPSGSNSANGQYGIPDDNPFASTDDLMVDEIFAYGLRNPFRFSFDSVTGDLYAGDVGQNKVEEIDVITSGGNYGWSLKEGSFFFNPAGEDPGFVSETFSGTVPTGLIDPIAEYDHNDGLSVIGGFVYRGTNIPALIGRYVFGDWGLDFTSPPGRLFYLDADNQIKEFWYEGNQEPDIFIYGFGEDSSGELYVLGNRTGTPVTDESDVNTGVLLKLSTVGMTATLPDGNIHRLYLAAFVNQIQ